MKVPKARKLPSGSWFIQMRLGGESVSITRNSEKECVRAAQYTKAEYLAGKREQKRADVPTLGAAIEAYIKARANVLSPASIRGYQIIRDNRFEQYMGTAINAIDFQAMCNVEALSCAPKTLQNAWRFVASVLREQGIQPPKVSLPQVPPNDRPFLEPEEIPIFIKVVKGTHVEIPALLALHSLRRSEICALTWENVDLKKKVIHVRGASVPGADHKFVIKKTNKNRSSTRTVPIMIDDLRAALEAVEEKSGLIVTEHPDTVRKGVNRVCKSAGLPEVGVHGLRHSFASLAYHLGMPEKVTMELGGWSDNQTMRKIYTHVAQSDRSQHTQAMSKFFEDANNKTNES